MTRKLKALGDGLRVVVRDTARDSVSGLDLARDLMNLCPADHHISGIVIRKDTRGLRCFVSVTFRRNRMKHYNVPGNHRECGPDCVITGDLCCGGHEPGHCHACDDARGSPRSRDNE